MDTSALIALLVFIIPMCFTPGPNNMLCAAHGAQHGFRSTIPLTLGMLTGWSVLGVIVGVAITAIESNQGFFDLLTYAGAAYIAYLGYVIAKSETKPLEEAENTDQLALLLAPCCSLSTGRRGFISSRSWPRGARCLVKESLQKWRLWHSMPSLDTQQSLFGLASELPCAARSVLNRMQSD